MKEELFIFIGGSDTQNGDYSRIHKLARTGGTSRWSSLKDVQPGDRVLIYIQKPHSSLIAEARVKSKSVKGKPGDYPYRAEIGDIQLLSDPVTIKELKEEFPDWNWLKYPRGKARVPDEYANRLWTLAHRQVQILISNAGDGLKTLRKLATNDGSCYWGAPKMTKKGDTVLFYIESPYSAIIARGKALSDAKPTDSKWYNVKVGRIQMLDSHISLDELRDMFPDWKWLRSMNMFSYMSLDRARELMERSKSGGSGYEPKITVSGGAGFGDSETNRRVEKAAVQAVTRHLQNKGFKVESREIDKIGYDLDAIKGKQTLHVEVKGISGKEMKFMITDNEVQKAAMDLAFRLYVVTEARSKQPKIHGFHGSMLTKNFDLKPMCYIATTR